MVVITIFAIFVTYASANCPRSHPFAYLGGDYCCKHGKEKSVFFGGWQCDGSIIDIDSSCCDKDEHKKCPASKCKNYKPICPVTLFDEFNYKGTSSRHVGSVNVKHNNRMSSLKLPADCCVALYEDDNFGGKSLKTCQSTGNIGSLNNKVSSLATYNNVTSEGNCPVTHRFAYLSGKYCCKHDLEKWVWLGGEGCDGSKIFIDSTCCHKDEHTKCPAGICRNYETTPNYTRYYIVRGSKDPACRKRYKGKKICSTRAVEMDKEQNVICCSDTKLGRWRKRKSCSVYYYSKFPKCVQASWSDAVDICSDAGGRLCTMKELTNNCAKRTRCRYNRKMVWSSTMA